MLFCSKCLFHRETSSDSQPHMIFQLVCSTPCTVYTTCLCSSFELFIGIVSFIYQHYCSVTHYSICSMQQSNEDLSLSVKAFFRHSYRFRSVLSKSCFIKNAWQLKQCWQYSAHQNGYIKWGCGGELISHTKANFICLNRLFFIL